MWNRGNAVDYSDPSGYEPGDLHIGLNLRENVWVSSDDKVVPLSNRHYDDQSAANGRNWGEKIGHAVGGVVGGAAGARVGGLLGGVDVAPDLRPRLTVSLS